jgi:hypothetical protein
MLGNLVEGLFAGFGMQMGFSPQANQSEDLSGAAASQSVDIGFLWPVDLGLEWSYSENPNIDVLSWTVPALSAGFGLDYTQMGSNTMARTLWSNRGGWR